MEYIILDLKTATEDQIKAAIECNQSTYRLMSSQIEALKRANALAIQKAHQVKEDEEPFFVEEDVQEESIDQEFEEEALFFYSEVKDLKTENIEENLEEVLPPRIHYNYERILRRIQAELLKEIKEIRDFMANESLEKEEVLELKNDINDLLIKINAISKELAKTPEEIATSSVKENAIVFVPTTGGNIRVLDDMERIPASYYKKFDALFTSIKDGTFKGVKKMQGALDGLAEVRDIPTGARVTFMRLDRNTYAIISAFVKKTVNNSGYQKMVENHYQNYRQQEQALKSNLSNPEFMELHAQYETELFDRLRPVQPVKSPLCKKEVK